MTYLPNGDFYIEVAKGNVPGHSKLRKFGRNPNVTAGPEDIDSLGGTVAFPTAAASTTVTYSSTDHEAGAGVRKVKVYGLGADWKELEEEVTLSTGGSPKTLTNQFIRVYRAYATEAGTYGVANTADITFLIGGVNQLIIPSSFGQSLTTHYTVPKGKTASLIEFHTSVSTIRDVNVQMWQRPNADDVTINFTGAKRVLHTIDGIGSFADLKLHAYDTFVGPTDLWVTATGPVAGSIVSAEYSLILYDT